MRDDAFQNWRRERDAVEEEMDRLITAGSPASIEERQARRTRFAALIERRESAARNLLQSGWARRRYKSPSDSLRPGDRLMSAAHAGAGAEGEQATFVPLPDGGRQAEAQSGLSAHVTTVVLASDVIALAPHAAAFPPDSVAAAGLPADAAEFPADVVSLAPDATALPPESAGGPTARLPADAPEPSTDVVALADDAADLPPNSAAVPAAGLPVDAAEPSTDVVALAPDAVDLPPDSAAVLAAGLPADAAEPPTDVVALAPDAAASPTKSTALFAPSVAVPAPDAVANLADAAPLAGDAKAQSALSSDDLHSDASLLKLLRRLQSKIGPAGNETVVD